MGADPCEGNAGADNARRRDDMLLVAQELRALIALLREQARPEPATHFLMLVISKVSGRLT